MLRLPRRQSISVKLPALISALLVVAIATFSIVAHLQLKRVLLATSAARVSSAAHVLGGFMEDSERRLRAEVEELSADPAVKRFASFPTAANRSAVQKSLTGLSKGGTQIIGIELRDKKLHRTLWVDGKSADRAAFIRNGPERPVKVTEMAVGPLRSDNGNISYSVVAPIMSSASRADTTGYVVVYNRISSTSGAQLIARLIGPEASTLIGNTDGKLWTDLSGVVRGPTPNRALKNVLIYNGPDGSRQIGGAARIARTPWVLWVGLPLDVAMAPANDFLRDMIIDAILLALIGALGALVITRHVAQPGREIRLAGRQVAADDYSRPVETEVLDQRRRAGTR